MTILLLLLLLLKVWFRYGLRVEEKHDDLLNQDSGWMQG